MKQPSAITMCSSSCVLILAFLALTTGQKFTTKIVKSGGDLQLSCESNEPIHWCYPEIYATADINEVVNYTAPVNVEYSKNYRHKITIDIKNISYIYTGFYHCVLNNSQDICNREMRSLRRTYVYVEDENRLMVIKGLKRVWAHRDESVILPCLPTHPKINITLTKGGLEVRQGKQDSGLNVRYDPTLGFILGPIVQKEVSFVCTATRGEQNEEFVIDIDIAQKSSELTPPLINGTWEMETNLTVMEGDSLELPCHSIQNEQMTFDIKWDYPNSSRVQINRNFCHSPGQICKNYTLALNGITAEDAGKYVCMIMSPPHRPEEASFELHVIQNGSKPYDTVESAFNAEHSKIYRTTSDNLSEHHHVVVSEEDISESQHQPTSEMIPHSNGNFLIPQQQNIVLILTIYSLICSYFSY